MVIDAARLCELWSTPRFSVEDWELGWGIGGDEVSDFGKAVVEPEVKGVWGRESRGGGECYFAEQGRDGILVLMFSI